MLGPGTDFEVRDRFEICPLFWADRGRQTGDGRPGTDFKSVPFSFPCVGRTLLLIVRVFSHAVIGHVAHGGYFWHPFFQGGFNALFQG